MTNMTIGERIAAKRKELGISQIALGEEMGVSRQSISKWEADAAIPEIDKLIALSRRFGVSVGWLLGVEEDAASGQTPSEFTDRDQELIEKLLRARPAMPRWQKLLMMATAACAAVSLVLSGGALYLIGSQRAQLERYRSDMEQVLIQLGSNEPDHVDLLAETSFECTPWLDLEGADFTFTCVPYLYQKDVKCALVITLDDAEVIRSECTWDGSRYTANFSLPAGSGYQCYLITEDASGVQWRTPVGNHVVEELADSLSLGPSDVNVGSASVEDGNLILGNLDFYVPLPEAFQNRKNLWTKFDLVLQRNGEEIGRIDLLNRSQYSAQANFSGPDVDFITQVQIFQLPALTRGDELKLQVECALATGHILWVSVDDWSYIHR